MPAVDEQSARALGIENLPSEGSPMPDRFAEWHARMVADGRTDDEIKLAARQIFAGAMGPSEREWSKQGIIATSAALGAFALPAIAPEAGVFGGAALAGGGAGIGQEAAYAGLYPWTHEPPSLKRGLTTALGTTIAGIGAEGSMNLLTRGLASMGGVQSPAVTEALSASPIKATRTVFGKPATTAEESLGAPLRASLAPRNVGLTEGRLATTSALRAMQESGQGVSIADTLTSLNNAIEQLTLGGIGSGARASLTRLKGIRADLMSKYIDAVPPQDIKGGLMGQEIVGRTPGRPPRITIDPQEADYINQQLQDAVGNAYGKAGGKESMRTLKGIGAVHTESFRTQTGTQESAAATATRLKAYETMRKQISETTPESFVRSVGDAIMTHGESGDQSALVALRNLDSNGSLEKQITTLAARREWTGSQSRIAHNVKWEFIRRLPRFLGKGTAIMTRPVGRAGSAAAAMYLASQKDAEAKRALKPSINPETASPEEMFPGMTHSPAQENP